MVFQQFWSRNSRQSGCDSSFLHISTPGKKKHFASQHFSLLLQVDQGLQIPSLLQIVPDVLTTHWVEGPTVLVRNLVLFSFLLSIWIYMYDVHVGLIGYFNYCFGGKRSLALTLPPPSPPHPQSNSPHLIDRYSNMAPRLSGQTTIF